MQFGMTPVVHDQVFKDTYRLTTNKYYQSENNNVTATITEHKVKE